MKKLLTFLLAALMIVPGLCACGKQDATVVRLNEVTHSVFYAPQYVAMSQGFFAAEGLQVELTNGGGADKVMTAVVSGQSDIGLAGPEASIYVYNQGKADHTQIIAQLTKRDGSFLVGRTESPFSWEDLRGKTIYASGKGNTPEAALNYVLTQNGIDPSTDVTIEWKSEQAECLSALMAEENAIAMLPQPFVTTAQAQSENLRVALDLTEEWDALQADSETPSTLVTGVVVARTAFAEEHPEVVSAFLDRYQESVDYVNSNVEEAAQLVGQYEIVTAEVAQKALPECNIVFIEGDEMKEKLSGYLSVLFEQNPQSVGGALPDDAFYFSR